ncbi:MAG: alpha/beta hydrolase-fold protein [Bacteroidales bacterium]
MKPNPFLSHLTLALLLLATATSTRAQDILLGFRDSLESQVLQETRHVYIGLPANYETSGKAYPVVYRLDGDADVFAETMGVVHRLVYMEEVVPEVIVVAIENTDRGRDMMPPHNGAPESGTKNFKTFIERELIPRVEGSYRTTGQRVLCAQSASTIFSMYCFLSSPGMFDAYVASSAGFPGCEPYFSGLTDAFLANPVQHSTRIFISQGGQDELDPDAVMQGQVARFIARITTVEGVDCRYRLYPDEGHVPFQSLYHGLKFVFE